MYYNKLRYSIYIYNILKRKKFLNKFNEIIKVIISKKRKKKDLLFVKNVINIFEYLSFKK